MTMLRVLLAGLILSALSQAAGALEQGSIRFGGAVRTYLVEAPASSDTPLPLVIVLHGGGGNAHKRSAHDRLRPFGAREGFCRGLP